MGWISALIAAIVLSGVVAASQARSGSTAAKVQRIDTAVASLNAQANMTRQVLTQCALDYPSGDNGTGFTIAYPAATAATALTGLQCPGAPAGFKDFWGGRNGVFEPVAPSGFGAWTYLNNATGVSLTITAASADAALVAAMDRVAAAYSATEATRSGLSLTVWIIRL